MVGDNELLVSSKGELELKLTKLDSLVQAVDKRIEVHKRNLGKLHNTIDREKTRDQIARLTRKILENS